MRASIERMTQEIAKILDRQVHSIWLYGSVVLGDFRLGWSDLDFLVLTKAPITEAQAAQLLPLRQRLSAQEPDNPYFRCFEGVIANVEEYLTGRYTRLVYWGTSGQRVCDRYEADVFSRYELARYGERICGEGDRLLFSVPDREEMIAAVRNHYEAIRRYAVQTDESLYSCGWLLDIARCLYTLRHGTVIGKTQAGRWALEERLFADERPMRQALLVRENPLEYKDRPAIRAWLRELGPSVQAYADVLEEELRKYP